MREAVAARRSSRRRRGREGKGGRSAAVAEGLKQLPVQVAIGWTEEQARKFTIRNTAYQLGFWGHGGGAVNQLIASFNNISGSLGFSSRRRTQASTSCTRHLLKTRSRTTLCRPTSSVSM